MVVISKYRQEWDAAAAAYQIHSKEEIVCPLCSGFMCCFGTRRRGLIQSCGVKRKLVIRRRKCRICGKIHHELPDSVVPDKRHGTETVGKVIAGDTDEVACEESTIRRIKEWWAVCRLYFESIISSLRVKYGAVFSANPAPREMMRAAANAHLWPSTRSAFLTG